MASGLRVDVVVRPSAPNLLTDQECRRLIEAAIDAAGAPADATVALTLGDDAELAALNEAHLGKSGPTDVLSFPLLPASAFPEHTGQDPATRAMEPPAAPFQLPPGEPAHLGDIIISVERAIEQAVGGAGGQTSDVRWSPVQELRLLITHGSLHLCGWDHADPVEESAMHALEARLLEPKLGDGDVGDVSALE
ncbi:MAG: rRNA maturation RNase YbeY [Chloroflexota bacterium]